MTFPVINLPTLSTTTIVPESEALFIPYLNRLYEDISASVNSKDFNYFEIPVTNTATNIPNIPNFGSYLVCISANRQAPDGSWPPSTTVALCKSSATVAGTVAVITSQAGQGGGVWGAATLTVTATATNYQINHSVAATTGNFNIRIVGTQ